MAIDRKLANTIADPRGDIEGTVPEELSECVDDWL
jgi:hypothetical protein